MLGSYGVLMLLSFGLMIGLLQWLQSEPLALSAGLLPLGLGLGLLFPIVTVIAQRVSPPQHMGIATAAPDMLRSLGGAAGTALLASLLTRQMNKELATLGALARDADMTTALANGVQSVFEGTAGVVLLAQLACAWLRPTERAERHMNALSK